MKGFIEVGVIDMLHPDLGLMGYCLLAVCEILCVKRDDDYPDYAIIAVKHKIYDEKEIEVNQSVEEVKTLIEEASK